MRGVGAAGIYFLSYALSISPRTLNTTFFREGDEYNAMSIGYNSLTPLCQELAAKRLTGATFLFVYSEPSPAMNFSMGLQFIRESALELFGWALEVSAGGKV